MKKSQARELATRALNEAVREDWPAVRKTFAEISADGRAVTFALMAWCDWTIAAQCKILGRPMPGPGEPAEVARPGWWNAETGKITLDADAVPPAARWAGRLVAARAALDEVQWKVLVGTMPGDGFKRGEFAAALLMGCAGMYALAFPGAGAA